MCFKKRASETYPAMLRRQAEWNSDCERFFKHIQRASITPLQRRVAQQLYDIKDRANLRKMATLLNVCPVSQFSRRL